MGASKYEYSTTDVTSGSARSNKNSELGLLDKKSSIIISTCSMGRRCLCDTIKPMLALAQAFGLVPLSLDHERIAGALGESTQCKLQFRWTSFAVIVNTILIIFFLTILPIARSEIKDRMSAVFTGTDLYAFTFQTLVMVLETTALLMFGRIHKQKFAQVLLTLCTCCFTVTVGAYATILQGEGMSSPQGKELTRAWGMQLYCAAIFLFLILISGQLVTNAAASAAPVLNSVPLSELDEKSQRQIMAFLHKISAFPTTMRAVNVTSISTTFLASASTNIITYLLVLMQFKLSFESWYGHNETDLTTAATNHGNNLTYLTTDNSTG
ncbi:unnamed protein product [Orchesella dallaii]|uniref:Uncharacterized protein n=1 Tax=Orchesella dallaii TaxID=48710 RepID=A0ABP1Q537_9HEXA